MSPDPTTSAAIERHYLKSMACRPTGELATHILNTSPDFDMEETSKEHGTAMGTILAGESALFRSHMIGVLNDWVNSDPSQDAEIIGLIRAGSPAIRKFLDSEEVAREFARRVGQRALVVLAEMTQKNRN
jgi:hypothetical protein